VAKEGGKMVEAFLGEPEKKKESLNGRIKKRGVRFEKKLKRN